MFDPNVSVLRPKWSFKQAQTSHLIHLKHSAPVRKPFSLFFFLAVGQMFLQSGRSANGCEVIRATSSSAGEWNF